MPILEELFLMDPQTTKMAMKYHQKMWNYELSMGWSNCHQTFCGDPTKYYQWLAFPDFYEIVLNVPALLLSMVYKAMILWIVSPKINFKETFLWNISLTATHKIWLTQNFVEDPRENYQFAICTLQSEWEIKLEFWGKSLSLKGKLTFNCFINPISPNPKKCSNTLKKFVGKFPTNCLSVFHCFVGLALKGFMLFLCW